MNKSNADSQSQVSLVKTLGSIIGGIGGIAGLTWVAGYLIIESFLVEMNLWGMVQFPLGFYKHALIQFVIDGLGTYVELWRQLLICFITVFFVYGWHLISRKRPLKIRILGIGIISIIALILFILLTRVAFPSENIVGTDHYKFIIYVFLVPFFFGTICFLIITLQKLSYHKSFRNLNGISIGLSIILFLLIPILYGKKVFTISIFEVVDIMSKEESFFNKPSNNEIIDSTNLSDNDSTLNSSYASNNNFITARIYVLGNTINREVFLTQEMFDEISYQVCLDKKMVKGLKINNFAHHDLRQYFLDSRKQSNIMAKSELSSLPLEFSQEQVLSEEEANIWEMGDMEIEKNRDKDIIFMDTSQQLGDSMTVNEISKWEQTGIY